MEMCLKIFFFLKRNKEMICGYKDWIKNNNKLIVKLKDKCCYLDFYLNMDKFWD